MLRHPRLLALAILLIVSRAELARGESPVAGREFSATFEFEEAGGSRRMGGNLVIDRVATLDETVELAVTLARGGQQSLLTALRGRRDGRLRLGAIDYPLDLVVVTGVDDPYRVVIVTSRPIRIDESQEGRELVDYPFGAVVFEIDGFGRGEGQLFRRAKLAIDSEGKVNVETYQDREGSVRDIRRLR